jgi:hypothetical protein
MLPNCFPKRLYHPTHMKKFLGPPSLSFCIAQGRSRDPTGTSLRRGDRGQEVHNCPDPGQTMRTYGVHNACMPFARALQPQLHPPSPAQLFSECSALTFPLRQPLTHRLLFHTKRTPRYSQCTCLGSRKVPTRNQLAQCAKHN